MKILEQKNKCNLNSASIEPDIQEHFFKVFAVSI
jgi:hypothetical protein